jgi:hypothetical protein
MTLPSLAPSKAAMQLQREFIALVGVVSANVPRINARVLHFASLRTPAPKPGNLASIQNSHQNFLPQSGGSALPIICTSFRTNRHELLPTLMFVESFTAERVGVVTTLHHFLSLTNRLFGALCTL